MPPSNAAITLEETLWPKWFIASLRFRNVPLLLAALCLACGIVLGSLQWMPPSLAWLCCGLLLALSLAALRWAPRVVLLPVMALWVAAGLIAAEAEPHAPAQTAILPYADNLSRTVEGHILRIEPLVEAPLEETTFDPADDGPAEREAEPAMRLDIAIDAVEDVQPNLSRMMPIHVGVRVLVLGASPQLQCGDGVRVPLQMRLPDSYRNPGVWQARDYLREQGIGALAHVNPIWIATTGDRRFAPGCRLHALATWASGRFMRYAHSSANQAMPRPLHLTEDDAAMLAAMLFGDRTRLDHSLRSAFERTGSFHIFVVAGMHLAVLAGGVYLLLGRLRIAEGWRVAITICLATLYALLTGFAPPVQRALVMTAVFLITRWLSRDRHPLNALGAAALVGMVMAPHHLLEASLQMTCLVIIAIAGIAAPMLERSLLPYLRAAERLQQVELDTGMPPRMAQFRILLRMVGERMGWLLGPWARSLPGMLFRWSLRFCELALICLVVELVMALPMAVYFHRLTLLSVPVNLLCVPVLGFLMPVALLTFCAALLHPWLAVLPAGATALLLHAIVRIAGITGTLPHADWRMPGPPAAATIAALLCWAVCVWALRKRTAWSWAAVALLPIAMAVVVWPYRPHLHNDALEVTALDVGQGDSILVASSTGRTLLIDAGGPVGSSGMRSHSQWDVGEDVVAAYLWSRGIRHLDAVALTHAHSDHMGGMPAVLRNFHPRELWVGVNSGSATFQALLRQAREQGMTIRFLHAGDAVDWGETALRILAPQPKAINGFAPTNNDSLVMELRYGKASVLLEGDAERESEQAMLDAGLVHPVNALKIGHHGSRSSTTEEFLATADPRVAVVSVGRRNTFGHPRREVLERLWQRHVSVRRTDIDGLSTWLFDREGHWQTVGPE